MGTMQVKVLIVSPITIMKTRNIVQAYKAWSILVNIFWYIYTVSPTDFLRRKSLQSHVRIIAWGAHLLC